MKAANGSPLRHHEKIAWSGIEPILNLVKNSSGGQEAEVLRTIGYSGNSANDWRRNGEAPLRAKYSLLGLAAELNLKVEQQKVKQFDTDELGLLLGLVIGLQIPEDRKQKLMKKISAEIANGVLE